MIDASELRIGNKVYYQWGSQPTDIRVDTVVSVHEGAFENHFPIHITEEVLLAVGFAEDSGYLKNYPLYSIKEHSKKELILIHKHSSCSHILYLHQLQNLFYSLTGTELNYTPK